MKDIATEVSGFDLINAMTLLVDLKSSGICFEFIAPSLKFAFVSPHVLPVSVSVVKIFIIYAFISLPSQVELIYTCKIPNFSVVKL